MDSKLKILCIVLVACILFVGYIVLQKPSPPPDNNVGQIVINPDPSDINPNDTVTQINHHIVIPPNVTKPTTVPDTVTSSDGTQTNNGEATVTPNPDGTITVDISEVIAVKDINYRYKILCDIEDFGFGYELIQYKKLSLDVVVYLERAGIGISYDVYRGIHAGVEETIDFSDGELETRFYVSVPLAIKPNR
jgi:hypothetical protein